ncbi:MAG: TonB C-terminal domain-containing protein [Betaproteobacteria bacterium]|nr:TonB C-terminal domain-containing protein [Betaproteobacteria bacterium]
MALFAFLWIGVSWQNEEGGSAEAEVWDIKVREAAPKAEVPEPVAEKKAEIPEPPVKEPEPVKTKTDVKPDIALEKEKKQKEEKLKEEKRKEEEAKKKEVTEEKKKQLKLADQKKADAIMAEEAKRLAAKSGSGSSGTSPYSTGNTRADAGYSQKVGAKIKSNTVFNVPEGLVGNPPVEYDVELLPDGSIKGIKKRKSSDVPGFDEAVLRAIEKSAPYPQDKSGTVPSRFNISHKPKG